MTLKQDEIKSWAVVRAIDADGQIVLDVTDANPSGCQTGGCGAGGLGCQTNAFARLLKRAPALKLKLSPDQSFRIGDALLLSLSQRALIRVSLMAYGMPLLALLVGMALGQFIAEDIGALVIGAFSLLSSWYLIGKLNVSCTPQVHDIKRLPD